MAERIVWTPADGSLPVDLTDEGRGFSHEAEGTRGLRSVSWAFASQAYAGTDGDDVQAVRAEAGRPALGLLVKARGAAELRDRIRRLVHDMRPKAGPGVLTVTTEQGASRQLRCYLEDGLSGDESDDVTMPGRWFRAILKFYAPDPWWYGDQVGVEFGLAAPSVFFSTTLPLPRSLSTSAIQGVRDIDLRGVDDAATGLWTITGPGVGLLLKRELLRADGSVDTTPMSASDPRPRYTKTLTSSVSVPDGGTVLVRTRPGEKSIRRGDGTNLGGTLAAGSSYWPLVDGRINRVSVQLGGAGGNSRAELAYRPKYGGI